MPNIKATTLRDQVILAHKFFEDTLAGVTTEQAHWQPSHKAHTIAANYAHVIGQEDVVISRFLQGHEPLILTQFAGKSGLSETPPAPSDHIPNWHEWAVNLKMDLASMSAYKKAVFENTDAYLASVTDAELAKRMDTGFLGEITIFELINMSILTNCQWHTGEISVVKGLQNLQGYPF